MKINGTPTENLERILQAEETTPIDLGCVSWVEEGQKEQKILQLVPVSDWMQMYVNRHCIPD